MDYGDLEQRLFVGELSDRLAALSGAVLALLQEQPAMTVADDHRQGAMEQAMAVTVELGRGTDLVIMLVDEDYMLQPVVHGRSSPMPLTCGPGRAVSSRAAAGNCKPRIGKQCQVRITLPDNDWLAAMRCRSVEGGNRRDFRYPVLPRPGSCPAGSWMA